MRTQHPVLLLRRFLTVACGMSFLWAAGAPAQERRPLEVRDDLGRTLVLTSPAQRIVSLAPSITECLFAIGAGNQIAGVTEYCTFPAAALTKPRVGGMLNPSTEAIINLQPDLVVVSMEGNLKEDAARLTALQIPVFVTNPRTLTGIRTSIEQLGLLAGREADAGALSRTLKRREDSLRASIPRGRVSALFLVSIRPLMVAGRGTFLMSCSTPPEPTISAPGPEAPIQASAANRCCSPTRTCCSSSAAWVPTPPPSGRCMRSGPISRRSGQAVSIC